MATSNRPVKHSVSQKVKSIENQIRCTLDGVIHIRKSDELQSDALMQATGGVQDVLWLQCGTVRPQFRALDAAFLRSVSQDCEIVSSQINSV
mmetsp:Transcript_14449/g.26364  ORF Transcript_14449/g.26364 Transcript_14449/m.26364 type:complete len:92 (+) Transcript_14449:922-1197(+)